MLTHVGKENVSRQQRFTPGETSARTTCLVVAALLLSGGCGTTRWTNSPRTGTELLLISSAVDRAVDRMDFQPLAGASVFLDSQYLSGTIDQGYIISSLRQKLLASGCALMDSRDKAQLVVEVRSGGVGTDQRDLVFGIPSVNVPPILGSVGGVPASIPEVPLIKKTAQSAVAKLAVFAYQRQSGRAVWQSGAVPVNSTAKDTWILGAGPFQQGTIYKGPTFAGSRLPVPNKLRVAGKSRENGENPLSVTAHALFIKEPDGDSDVQLAGHEAPVDDEPSAEDK